MNVDRKELGAAAVFLAVAAIYGSIAWTRLPIGQTLAMGPGYFPVVLSVLIGIVGMVLAVKSLGAGAAPAFTQPINWRALVLISLSIVLFGAFLREVGLFLAVAGVVFLSSLASREFRILRTVLLSVGLATLCALVFGYGVKLPIPIIGTWFTG